MEQSKVIYHQDPLGKIQNRSSKVGKTTSDANLVAN